LLCVLLATKLSILVIFERMNTQNIDFWEKKYEDGQTGWDIGYVSTPIKEYFDQIKNKDLQILIPGAGNSYEAEYLYNKGFTNITVIDWSKSALNNILERVPNFPKSNLLAIDFFDHKGSYDIIIEQTFFCAINPDLRTKYISKSNNLLKENGKLIGLLFNIPLFTDHPPYGGNKEEYIPMFEKKFNIKTMEIATNSIDARKNNELFIIMQKK